MSPLPDSVSIRLTGDSLLESAECCPLTLRELQDLYVGRVLEMCNGNRQKTAQILGIGRTSLYRHLKRKGIYKSESEHSSR